MFIKHWILVAALVAVAYAATEPLDLSALEETQDSQDVVQHVREKRFLLAKKALLVGGALGLGVGGAIGLAKGAFLGGGYHYPVYTVRHVYSEPYYHYGYSGGHGWYGHSYW